ncbi:TonB-dependent receptor [Pedobacter cryotolerans]|uniref:TonB-dependent receptor n=1 Tax=Pedobacter cryotolerans TaxID=2571270 RepID=A0A4V6WN00_9SPHI|nr:TonB-dependent receptor [Pedobacter cryotolerans]TKC01443.1 TonB-dependent receptor [Pedobacter cryotolerans]
MKYLLILVAILFFGITVNAQTGKIFGTVVDQYGNPVEGIAVQIKSLQRGLSTSQNGSFEFKDLPYGSYALTITSIQFKPYSFQIQLNKPELQHLVKLVSANDQNLKEVAIVQKTVKKEIETSGFAVSIIETKEASLRNLTTNELLDRAVGVRVRQNGGEGSPIEYNLNGMSGSTIGLFLDGIEISTYGSSFNLNNIPPAMIERIEVYKGVLPSHLSGNYIGGAINVIMKKDASANNLNAAVSYGSFNTYRADVGALYRNQKNGFTTRISGFYSHSDNNYEMWGKFSKYTLPGGRIVRNYRTLRPNDKFETIGGRFEVGFTDVKWADQFFIGYNVSDSYKEIPHGITMTKPYFGRFNEYQANVFSLNYAKKDLLIDGLALNVNAVHSKRSTYLQDTVSLRYNWDGTLLVKNADGPPETYGYEPGKGQQGDAVMTNIDRTITNVRSNLSYNIFSSHRLSFNHKFEKSNRNDQDLLIPERSKWITQNDLTTNIFAMNYEADLLKGKLKTNIFGKYAIYQTDQLVPVGESNGVLIYQNNSVKRDNKGFGGTLSYQAIDNGYLIFSAEKSFIMPTDRHIYGEPENNLLANPAILPELAVNYNLGARYGFSSSELHKVAIYANGFWRNGYDKIIQQTRLDPVIEGRENQVEDIQVTQFVNLAKTQSLGFEAEINYIYNNRLNAMLNFSKFNTLFKLEQDERGNPNTLYNRQVPNEPFFTVNANVQYRFNDVFQKRSVLNAYYNAGYVGAFSTIWIESEWFTTPTQFAHDLGASYRFPSGKLVASLDCKNILNAELYDNFGVQKPGRAFYFKLNFTINNLKK